MPGLGAGVGNYISLIPGASLIPGLSAFTEDFQIDLGTFTLQGFEEPPQIGGGTTQAMDVHQYPGGVRTVDTWGAEPEDPTFSGRMMGPTAEQRVQALETIVQQGVAVNFTYSQKQMLVVLKKLTWDFYNYYDIAYTMTIEVISDLGLANPGTIETQLDDVFTSDIASISSGVGNLVGSIF